MTHRANSSDMPREVFFCARCQMAFEERPLFCPNCDRPEQRAPSEKVGFSSLFYIAILFGPLILAAVLSIWLGWGLILLVVMLYALAFMGVTAFLVLTWSFLAVRQLFRDCRGIEKEFEFQASRPQNDQH